MGSDDYELLEPNHVWEDDLMEADLKELMLELKFFRLSGLKELHLSAEPCVYATTLAKKAKWKGNVRKFRV